MKVNNKYYIPDDEYGIAVERLSVFANTLLFEFAKRSNELKDKIIRNFIAKGIVLLKSIYLLWEKKHYGDAIILYRALVDRLIHLMDLNDNDSYQLFNEWSFVKQFEQRNRPRSDKLFKDSLNPKFWTDTHEQRKKYEEYKSKFPQWKRPNAEKVAKRRNLGFIFSLGYDYGSMYVHPMADDGLEDFKLLTNVKDTDAPIDRRSIISNACSILIMIIQEGFNGGTLSWRALCYNFLDDFRKYLGSGNEEYKISFLKIGYTLEEGINLCIKRQSKD